MNSIKLVSFPNKEIVFLIAFLPSGTIHVLDTCNHRDSAPLHSMGTLHCTFPNCKTVYVSAMALCFSSSFTALAVWRSCVARESLKMSNPHENYQTLITWYNEIVHR